MIVLCMTELLKSESENKKSLKHIIINKVHHHHGMIKVGPVWARPSLGLSCEQSYSYNPPGSYELHSSLKVI